MRLCLICQQPIPNTRRKHAVTCSKECGRKHDQGASAERTMRNRQKARDAALSKQVCRFCCVVRVLPGRLFCSVDCLAAWWKASQCERERLQSEIRESVNTEELLPDWLGAPRQPGVQTCLKGHKITGRCCGGCICEKRNL